MLQCYRASLFRCHLDNAVFYEASQSQDCWIAYYSISYPLVVDSLELGWKPISSHRPADTSENFCWRVHYFTLHYCSCRDEGYSYETVDQSIEFVLDSGTHNNTSESRWNHRMF